MKVLVLAPRLPHQNILSGHKIVRQRILRLAARGHSVGLCCFTRPSDLPTPDPELIEALREIECVPDPAFRKGAKARVGLYLRGVPPFHRPIERSVQRLVGDMTHRSRYDVVLAEYSEMGLFLRHNPYLPAVRTVISIHQCATVASQKRIDLLGFTPAGLWERMRREWLRHMESRLYQAADRLLVLTPQERYQLLTVNPSLPVSVVPSGVDTDVFQPMENAFRTGIVFTGYYTDEPNRDAVRWFCAQVWPRLVARFPHLMFFVVGPHPPPDLLEIQRRDPRIVVTDRVPDVRDYLLRAAVYVCPARMGSGMRGKILEAMASGIPVVSTTAGMEGIPAQPGESCLLADEAGVMARQIELLLLDPELRSRLARHAHDLIVRRLSWTHSIDQLETVLQRLRE
ncbi:MAG: glycosyltransferase [Kiritimatiellia bacterium]|nr:glycosyltransferase [Kiritimatiellia bacterium]